MLLMFVIMLLAQMLAEKKRCYFGTDGIRGYVGNGNVTPEFVLKLGWAVGRVFTQDHDSKSKVLIGKDTRISGYMFESALQAGLSAAGVDIYLAGPIPTPAIAYLTRTFHAQAGIVISASHNPYHDNGIKFFSSTGTKLSDDVELAIEEMIDKPLVTVQSTGLGKAYRIDDAAGRYVEFCKSTVPFDVDLYGIKLVLDCAHGATYHIAPDVFKELGADVVVIGAEPDGLNINQHCGSAHLSALQQAVTDHKADLGIAFDGDGDRVAMVDNKGNIVDGDVLLFIIARSQQRQGLPQQAVVGTVMSNLGLEHALAQHNIKLHRANVGDRYVVEKLEETESIIGGEPSGHIVCLNKTTTGDGIIAAMQVLTEMRQTGKSLYTLASCVTKYPQKIVNVATHKPVDLSHRDIKNVVVAVKDQLGDDGRVLIRPSGTEPLIRIMVEGKHRKVVDQSASELSAIIGALAQ